MPMVRPSPTQLRDRITAAFSTLTDGADPRLLRSVEMVLARVQVICSQELLSAISWASRQMHISTADADGVPARAATYRIGPADPVAARGPVTIAGNVDASLAALTELRRQDDARYRTVETCEIGGGGTGTVDVVAVAPGRAGNAIAGTTLTIVEPVANIAPGATVGADGLRGGLDVEGFESVRARTLARIQKPPQGGADRDYEAWVQEVVGKTRVWVNPITPSPGYVTVYFLMPDGSIPAPATVELVAAHIEAVRPTSALNVFVLAPVADEIDFEIAIAPDATSVREAAEAELADMLLREATPGGTIPSSRITATISAAAGEYSHERTEPPGSIVSAPGHIARLGSITWIT